MFPSFYLMRIMHKSFFYFFLLCTTYSFGFGQNSYIYKGSHNQHLEIIPKKTANGIKKITEIVYPSSLHNISFTSSLSSAENIARDYLKKQGYRIGIKDVNNTLKYMSIRQMPTGYRVHFQQMYKEYPVYKSGVVVSLNKEHQVIFVANSYKPAVVNNQKLIISDDDALQISKNHLSVHNKVKNLKTNLMIFYHDGISKLVRKVNFISQGKNSGDWEFLIDAETGEIIKAKDQALYLVPPAHGKVFDPDPITRSGQDYGSPGFTDNDNMDSPQLNQQLIDVELLNLTQDGGSYRLKNKYASIVDYEAPYTGLFIQDSLNFNFTRHQDAFEAVNAFYHISQSMSYINDTLGIILMPYQYSGGVRFDPHGLQGDDNSWYLPDAGYLAFGDGGIDDAEDQDVIIHELGHGIHDWLTNGSLSQVEGLSEGCGDYWAQSYKRAKGFMDSSNPKYNWVYSWDGHNTFWDGRQTNYGAKYPSGLTGVIHTDGQIWSSALMKIYDQIGRRATDLDFLDALSMLNENSGQRDAAYAFIQADIENYNGDHLQEIAEVFSNTGYVKNPIAVFVKADVTGGPANLTVHFSDIVNSHISWQWDFENDGVIDSQEKNPTHIYTKPGLYTVALSVSDGFNSYSDSLIDYISVNAGAFVWEGIKDGRDNSGRFIYNFLKKNKIPCQYSRSSEIPGSLIGYNSVFLSFGNGFNATAFNNKMALSVQEYLQNGGNLYIEGADALSSYSQNSDFLSLFGLSLVDDGNPDRTQLNDLSGQPGSIFDGLTFTETGQQQENSIDTYEPNPNGKVAFIEGEYGNVAMQSEGDFGQKAVLFSYALAEIIDKKIPVTRDDILINILNFFNISLPLTPRFSADKFSGNTPLLIKFLNYSVYDKMDSSLKWYWDFDNDGITDAYDKSPTYVYESPGLFDVKMTVVKDADTVSAIAHNFIHTFNGESALNFNEDENYVTIEPKPKLNLTNEFTIEFWIFPEDWGNPINGFTRLFDKGNIQLSLRKSRAGKYNPRSLIIYIKQSDGHVSSYSSPDSSIVLNKWQQIAISFDSINKKVDLYIDGQPVNISAVSDPVSGPVMDNADSKLMFAESYAKHNAYVGKIDEVRLWNIALPDYKIQSHWNRYISSDQPELVGYWNFNEAWGDTLRDLTLNAADGLIKNPEWVEGKPDLLPTALENFNDKQTVTTFRLFPNFPNPFNPETQIKFQIPQQAHVSLIIYDVLGKEIKTIVNADLKAGLHLFKWDGKNNVRQQVASGIYFYFLNVKSAGNIVFKDYMKMILIR